MWIDTSIRWVCAIILWTTFLVMFLPTFANAFLRYTTDASIVWSEQAVRLVFPWFILGGAVIAAQHNRHIGVSVLTNLLGRGNLRRLQIVVQLIILGACAVVFDFAVDVVLSDDSMYTLIGIKQSWSYLALIVGYVFLALTCLTNIYRLVTDPAYSEKIKTSTVS
ncbi:TRAP transporter small permease [Rhodobium gokarnense]|uniref:TRAP transporter small permease protein n=1 Tax=Rhodobium gokarnense TaxID=364296 RepID=A0ABT3HEZ7_9HYPH|nr:TRAP transporter small permease [Rhodobium gokarnense]MCW2308970.1 TRAP-type C4-dicarboxylate transport system permease small subunit [Rhodobium gokarnense]